MKYIKFSFFLILLCFSFNSFSQKNIFLKVESLDLSFNQDTSFKIPIRITNASKKSIKVPKYANVTDKKSMSRGEIGIEMFNNTNERIECSPNYQDIGNPNFLTINSNETKTIYVNFTGTCFLRKGSYFVKFFLMSLETGESVDKAKFFSSNRITINIK